MARVKIKESDMFEPLKKWLIEELDCDGVYGEVQDIDVFATCGAADIVIEMKTTVSMKLLEQVLSRLHHANYTYVCIPRDVANKLTNDNLIWRLSKDYGFGILSCSLVDRYNVSPIYIERRARFVRMKHKRGILRRYITPYHDNTIGGATSKEKNSPYQQTIKKLKIELRSLSYNPLRENIWIPIETLIDKVETHYANPKSSVAATLQESWNRDWCECKVINGKRMFRYINGEKDAKRI